MIVEEKIGKASLRIEIIFDNKELLDKRNKDIYDHYKNSNLTVVFNKVASGEFNSFISLKIKKKGIDSISFLDIDTFPSLSVLLETYIEIFKKSEWYEACAILKKYLNNINY